MPHKSGIIASAKAAVGGGGGASFFKQAYTDGTDGTTFTFASVPIGTASATRRVIVGIGWGGASATTLAGVTIGGVTATIDVDSGAAIGNRRTVIASAIVPTGTTANVVVTMNASTGRMGIGVWAADGINPTGQTAIVINAASGTLTTTTAVGAKVIAVGYSSRTSGSIIATWTGATERYNQVTENTFDNTTGADTTAVGTSTSIDFATDAGNARAYVAAVYA